MVRCLLLLVCCSLLIVGLVFVVWWFGVLDCCLSAVLCDGSVCLLFVELFVFCVVWCVCVLCVLSVVCRVVFCVCGSFLTVLYGV